MAAKPNEQLITKAVEQS